MCPLLIQYWTERGKSTRGCGTVTVTPARAGSRHSTSSDILLTFNPGVAPPPPLIYNWPQVAVLAMGPDRPPKGPGNLAAAELTVLYGWEGCMDLTFDRGDSQRPRGHALLYFRVDTEPDKVYATYVVILPVQADFGKYVPPFLASHLGNLPLNDFSAFAMPPVPEPVDSYRELERLCELREDDLVFGSNMFSFDLPRMMESTTEAVQTYAQLCTEYFDRGTVQPGGIQSPRSPEAVGGPSESVREREGESAPESDTSYQVNEVLFSLMGERDKLAELGRLLGRLQFAQEGRDEGTTGEVTEEINALARYLPEEFQVLNLLAFAREPTAKGSRLAQLYLDRCFRLSDGDTVSVLALEAQIADLKAQG